jgi:DNA-binding Lrp family transcriptional regulator
LSPPALQKRLRKLEEKGIIEHIVALVNRERVGFDLLCFVQVNLRHHEVQAVEDFKVAVQDMTEVLECYHLTGEMDYLLKVVVRNRKHLERFLIDTLTPAPGVDKIRTSLALSDVKVTTKLPIE